jgi:hypothetical protein
MRNVPESSFDWKRWITVLRTGEVPCQGKNDSTEIEIVKPGTVVKIKGGGCKEYSACFFTIGKVTVDTTNKENPTNILDVTMTEHSLVHEVVRIGRVVENRVIVCLRENETLDTVEFPEPEKKETTFTDEHFRMIKSAICVLQDKNIQEVLDTRMKLEAAQEDSEKEFALGEYKRKLAQKEIIRRFEEEFFCTNNK